MKVFSNENLITTLQFSTSVWHSVTTKYYYDGDKLITEYTSSSKRRLDFLYDENDILYGFIYNNSNKYFYIRDFMQNIVGIVDNVMMSKKEI
jgi:hypothetical protein